MVIDKSNMKQVLTDFPKQCREAMSLAKGMKIQGNFNRIIVAGMGGSAIAGDLLKTYLFNDLPVEVIKNYNIPEYVDENTLMFAISYSGNTEETLSALTQAKNRKATTVAVTSGGHLSDMTDTVIKIPAGLQPRNAVGYLFFPIIGLLYNSGIIKVKNTDLNELIKVLSDTEYFSETGRKLARKIREKTPIIYSSSQFDPVAYRFKCEINENGKHPAYYHVFPELCHNELVGFSGMERNKFLIIMIKNNTDNERIQLRMDICKKLFENTVDVEEIKTHGESLLARMFSVIYIGDWTSYHLALLKRIDPSPVDVIEDLKGELRE